VLFPPYELLGLLSDGRCTFAGQDISKVAINQVSERVALGFRSREVSSLKDGSLSDLHPLASIRDFGKGG
jgi:hypothetical protein